ncbi:hypothetical protein YWY31_50310 [Paenibacillus illinoisensis]
MNTDHTGGVKCTHSVLENHAQIPAPFFAHVLLRELVQIYPLEQNPSGLPDGWFIQAHDGPACHRLAAPAFSYNGEALPLPQLE